MRASRRGAAAALSASLGVLLVVAALTLVGCTASTGTTSRSAAPAFSGVTLDGAQVSQADYLGKPLVLVFMASWCGPCREEAPEIDKFYRENTDRAFVLAVAVSDTEADIRGLVTGEGWTFPVMLDGDRAAGAYGVTAIPTTVVIDAEGNIVKRLVGGTTAAKLSLVIDGLTR